MQASAQPIMCATVEGGNSSNHGTFVATTVPSAAIACEPQSRNGLLTFKRTDLRPSNPKPYKAISGGCGVVSAALMVAVAVVCVGILTFFSIQTAMLPNTPEGQNDFYKNNSWCFITPRRVDDEDSPCVHPSWLWDSSAMMPSDYYDGKPCYDDSADLGFAFCNTDPDITIDWCKDVFDRVVFETNPYTCWFPEFVFTTPANYSTIGFDYVHETAGFGYYLWGSCTAVYVWGALSITFLCLLPRSLRRSGNTFEITRNAGCCSQKIPVSQIKTIHATDSFQGYSALSYRNGGAYRHRRLNCCSVAFNRPLVWFTTHVGRRFGVSMSTDSYNRFLEENLGFTPLTTVDVENVTVAVPLHHDPEPQKV
eukprot:INCI3053.1.p1 GENE.INCI3053.1~~INCI3053.1.p1  ORF type:complete len:416 (+),score=45.10 INCI3053.1:153-1250(+)